MNHDREMTKYRNRLSKRFNRRGRRKSDAASPRWIGVGDVLEVLFLAAIGLWLLTACAKGAL